MNSRLLAFGTLFLLLTTFSCKKTVESNAIFGKWKLVEQYNGYANGGNFQWNAVPPEYSHILTFTEDGNYQKTDAVNGTPSTCIGTYFLQADNKLEINTGCNTMTEKCKITELTSTTLILDWAVIEGVIRFKYAASQ